MSKPAASLNTATSYGMTTIRHALPQWDIQQPIFVRKAHFHFVPTEREVISHVDKGSATTQIAYSQLLPKDDKVVETRGVYDLDCENIPGLPQEEYEPPMGAFAYRVRFYYTSVRTPQEYWNSFGKCWSHDVDKFASPSLCHQRRGQRAHLWSHHPGREAQQAIRRRDEAGQHPLLPRALDKTRTAPKA